jgi:hypothetical protein
MGMAVVGGSGEWGVVAVVVDYKVDIPIPHGVML